MEQKIILDGLSPEEQKIVNDVLSAITVEDKHNNMKKWVERCKDEIQFSAPRHDGYDVDAWLDECEVWLLKMADATNIKFSTDNICDFRCMLYNWVVEQYENIA